MVSAAQTIPVGPFTGGLNTKSDPSALAENELAVCENFELDFDGSLKQRPPFADVGANMPLNVGGGSPMMLGFHRAPTGTAYLIASDGVTATWAYNVVSNAWTAISGSLSATDIASYNGQLWLVAAPGSGQTGGYWDGSTFTAVANMPKGTSIASYKGLLYIGAGAATLASPNRLYYSNSLTAGTFWPSTANFADIGYGDGEAIVQLVVSSTTLLVFRSNSIWTYSWSSTPAGFVTSPLVQNVGLDNPLALEQLDGIIYFIHEQRAYSLTNGRVDQLNERVPLAATATANFSNAVTVSVLNKRVLFGFYDTTYCYSTETAAWTTWKYPVWQGIGKLYQRTGYTDQSPVGYAFPSALIPLSNPRSSRLLKVIDAVTSAAETFTCTMQTKTLDYDTTSQYKRLFYWGLDALFRNSLTAQAVPVTYQNRVTWGQMLTTTWGASLNYTWGQPLTGNLTVTSNRAASGAGPVKKYVKLNKSLRFRQIYYRVSIGTDGSTATAPVKVFDLVTFVRVGERAVKTIS